MSTTPGRRAPGRPLTLRGHLVLLVLGAVLPVLAFTAVMATVLWRQQRAAFEQRYLERVRAMAIALDRELEGHVRVLKVLAQSELLVAGDMRGFYEHANRVKAEQPGWATVILADTTGAQVFNLRRAFGSPLPKTAFGEPAIARVVVTGQPLVSALVTGRVLGTYTTNIGVPVERQGTVSHVLIVAIDPPAWLDFLGRYPVAPDATMTLLDPDGIVVARTLNNDRWVGQRPAPALYENSRKTPEGAYRSVGLEGQRFYSAHSRSTVSGWTVATGVPAARVEAALRGSTRAMIGGALVMATLAVGLAWLIGRRIAQPIQALTRTARGLATGETVAPERVAAVAEVGELRQAFADASTLLKQRAARLGHVLAIADIGLTHSDRDDLFRHLLTRLRAALEADTATILLLTSDGRHLTPVSSDGLAQEVEADVRIPMDRGAAGRIAESDHGLILTDLGQVDVVSPFLRDRVKSLVGVPLRIGDRLIGVLHVGAAATRRFTDADLELLRLVADRAARAIERAGLMEAEQRARADAEAANRAKDEFLGVLSHELRTPLNAVYGWARVLQAGELDAAARAHALDVIMRNANAQVQLVDDLLDVSRIISGKMRLDVQPVDLHVVVQAALDAVRPAAAAKDIQLRHVLDPRAVGLTGDPNRLQQVVWNLLINAVKFTPKGGRVQVHLQRINSRVELVVTDTGQGIDPAVLPFIFDRFRQADSGTARAHGGLGLGLALVRHLVELHGGRVTAQSGGPGQGATFTVTLPLAAVTVPSDGETEARVHPTAMTPPAAASIPSSLRGVRVLVVDDDRDSVELAAAILAGAGAETRTCTSAPEGFRLLQEWRPDVLIADIEMPGEDGFAFIKRVRALDASRGGKTPAVALTAYGRVEDRMRTLSAGYNMHVPKPVDPAELVTIAASLAGR